MKYLLISTEDLELINNVKELVNDSEKSNVICLSDSLEETVEVVKIINSHQLQPGIIGIGTDIANAHHIRDTENLSSKMPVVLIAGNNSIFGNKVDVNEMLNSDAFKELSKTKMDFELTPNPIDLDYETYEDKKFAIREPSKQSYKPNYKYHK